MALPIFSDVNTLNRVSGGVPFNITTSKNTIDTFTLNFAFKGTPFIAAIGGAPLVPPNQYNTAQFFMVF